MTKKKIAFDLDDTLLDSITSVLNFYNERKGTRYVPDDFLGSYIEKVLDISSEKWLAVVVEYYDSEHGASVCARIGAQEMLAQLRDRYEIHIITARAIELEQHSLHSIGRNFLPGDFTHVHFTNSLKGNHKLEKWEVCKKFGIELLIDDYHKNLNLAAENGIPGILIEVPWNHNAKLHPLVKRAKNLQEVCELLS